MKTSAWRRSTAARWRCDQRDHEQGTNNGTARFLLPSRMADEWIATAISRFDPSSTGTPQCSKTSQTNCLTGISRPAYQTISRSGRTPATSFPASPPAARLSISCELYGIPDDVYSKMRERVFLFAGFNPEWNDYEEDLNYGPNNGGVVPSARTSHLLFERSLDAK